MMPPLHALDQVERRFERVGVRAVDVAAVLPLQHGVRLAQIVERALFVVVVDGQRGLDRALTNDENNIHQCLRYVLNSLNGTPYSSAILTAIRAWAYGIR